MANAQKLFERAYEAQQNSNLTEAIKLYKNALAKKPKHADAAYMLGTLLASTGKAQESIPLLERASRLLPHSPMIKCNLGLALKILDRLDEAEVQFRKALQLDPNLAQALNNLSALLINKGYPCDAETFARRCIALQRTNTDYVSVQLANALADQGKIDEAITTLEQIVKRNSSNDQAWHNLLSLSYYSDKISSRDILDKHQAWAERLPNQKTIECTAFSEKLKVGYLSPDFGFHPVGLLIAPLLANHDKKKVETFLYHDSPRSDALSKKLKSYAGHWLPVSRLSDTELKQQIQWDGIDILVDLCGHLSGNRLSIFAARCAPIQLAYLGYPGSTGLKSMDYVISDSALDPAERNNEDYSETLIRLDRPCFAFQQPASSPEIAPSRSESITFGSFNNARKITYQVLDAWIEILEQVPGSRLIFQSRSYKDPEVCRITVERFQHAGISSERLEFHGMMDFEAHLNLITKTDICLDPWPWNGHMTTLNTLWMGVPVLTLSGDRRSTRMGGCILSELEMDEWIAQTPCDYIAKAVKFASSSEKLKFLRGDIRQQMQRSRLMNGQDLAQEMEAAFNKMILSHSVA